VLFVVSSILSAGCSTNLSNSAAGSDSATSLTSSSKPTVQDPSIPGIGATRDDWDSSHTRNPYYDNNKVYGEDHSLPQSLSPDGAVYISVNDYTAYGVERIGSYVLNMYPVPRDAALMEVRRELPSDSTVAWDLNLDSCYRAAFISPTLAGVHRMAEIQIQDVRNDGTLESSPEKYNQADLSLNALGAQPDPDVACQ
jgi:hypothetical protein